jgi:hypothetical protein
MPQSGPPHTAPARVALFASAGPELTHYDVGDRRVFRVSKVKF